MLNCKGGLAADKSAAVAVMFAVMLVPMCMTIGIVVDFGWALQAKSALDLAADTAALAAVRTAASGYNAGQSSSVYLAEGKTAASQWWTAQAGTVPEVVSSTNTPSVTQTGQTFTATIAYTANVFEVLPKIFNWKNASTGLTQASIANSSTASITVNAYGTIDFLLDNTSSMMLPATDADLLKLQTAEQTWLKSTVNQALVSNSGANGLVGWNSSSNSSYSVSNLPLPAVGNYCAFACHWSASSSAANPTDYYGLARKSGETLRFDVVQSATVTAIQQMESLEQVNGQLSVGVFAFGGLGVTTSAYLTTIFPEAALDPTISGVSVKSAGGSAAIAALQTITPPVSGDIPNTNIGTALADTLAITGVGGTGNTAASPLKSLILVTDGVEDDTNPQSIPSTEGPIKPSVCTAIKNAGYTLYVLYTPYNSEPVYLPNNIALQPYITGADTPSILSALQSCASSPSDVIEATLPADIQAGMATLIDEAVGRTSRLTN